MSLVVDDTSELNTAATVTIPAGASFVEFSVSGVDDTELDGPQIARLTANATGYVAASQAVTVEDAEFVFISLDESSLNERSGRTSVTLRRSNVDIQSALLVQLGSSDTSELNVPSSVTIPAGQSSVTFDIQAVDDNLLDGTQSVKLLAMATGYLQSEFNLEVTDVETLTVSLTSASVLENAGTVQGTVSRSNTDTQAPLAVSLASSNTGAATTTAVVIPAGQTSVQFTLTIVNDTLLDGSQTTEIRATAQFYEDGVAQLEVRDDEGLVPWRNPRNSLDVDNSGVVVPLDALLLINSLNTEGARQLPSTLPDPLCHRAIGIAVAMASCQPSMHCSLSTTSICIRRVRAKRLVSVTRRRTWRCWIGTGDRSGSRVSTHFAPGLIAHSESSDE